MSGYQSLECHTGEISQRWAKLGQKLWNRLQPWHGSSARNEPGREEDGLWPFWPDRLQAGSGLFSNERKAFALLFSWGDINLRQRQTKQRKQLVFLPKSICSLLLRRWFDQWPTKIQCISWILWWLAPKKGNAPKCEYWEWNTQVYVNAGLRMIGCWRSSCHGERAEVKRLERFCAPPPSLHT